MSLLIVMKTGSRYFIAVKYGVMSNEFQMYYYFRERVLEVEKRLKIEILLYKNDASTIKMVDEMLQFDRIWWNTDEEVDHRKRRVPWSFNEIGTDVWSWFSTERLISEQSCTDILRGN